MKSKKRSLGKWGVAGAPGNKSCKKNPETDEIKFMQFFSHVTKLN